MREIKFRGIDRNGGWRFGDLITDTKEFRRTCDAAYIMPHWETLNAPIGVIKETLGQYTGLKDKNGVEIFEGDIVELEDYKHDVEYSTGEWCIGIYRLSGRYEFCEVIGNIYENKELLEELK